jgi:2-oxo-4-hydroxy-4-carboxy-5-ureidoimidazoline decarboxylase
MPSTSITLETLNGMSGDDFRRALGAVFERSPWVAERAWPARPFPTREALHAAMAAAVGQASRQEQLALLRAHPDLGGKAARAGAMTDASVAEQSSAGLDRLSHEEYERFERLNAAYHTKFGFPFVIAVRHHDKRAILEAFGARLGHSVEQELEAAFAQVFDIARLRLDGLVVAR